MTVLDPALVRSARAIAELPLSTLLLKEDARWPWLILVPRVAGAESLADLGDADAGQLMEELRACVRAVAAEDGVERVNVGQLGNVVSQLHVHVVGRWAADAAWPGPVWGVEGKRAYEEDARASLTTRLLARLSLRRPAR